MKLRETGDVVLTHQGKAVATSILLRRARAPRQPGSARGLIVHRANDQAAPTV
ncbi:hypothetical protein [Longimicrobium sp.]|uniref:hypothetical protein n=1 Tax=Longimicrobium sp. TaxID=2029185 RepID=UPI003B3AE318